VVPRRCTSSEVPYSLATTARCQQTYRRCPKVRPLSALVRSARPSPPDRRLVAESQFVEALFHLAESLLVLFSPPQRYCGREDVDAHVEDLNGGVYALESLKKLAAIDFASLTECDQRQGKRIRRSGRQGVRPLPMAGRRATRDNCRKRCLPGRTGIVGPCQGLMQAVVDNRCIFDCLTKYCPHDL
jgi:hypothetical protein